MVHVNRPLAFGLLLMLNSIGVACVAARILRCLKNSPGIKFEDYLAVSGALCAVIAIGLVTSLPNHSDFTTFWRGVFILYTATWISKLSFSFSLARATLPSNSRRDKSHTSAVMVLTVIIASTYAVILASGLTTCAAVYDPDCRKFANMRLPDVVHVFATFLVNFLLAVLMPTHVETCEAEVYRLAAAQHVAITAKVSIGLTLCSLVLVSLSIPIAQAGDTSAFLTVMAAETAVGLVASNLIHTVGYLSQQAPCIALDSWSSYGELSEGVQLGSRSRLSRANVAREI